MSRELSPSNAAAYQDVLDHLRVHGARNWKAVREAHQSVPARSWWRIVKRAKAALPALKNREVAAAFATAVELSKIASAVSVPPPAALRRADKDTAEAVDLMSELRSLLIDADSLRDYALSPANDKGVRTIKNPMYYVKSIGLKRDLVETILRCFEQMFRCKSDAAVLRRRGRGSRACVTGCAGRDNGPPPYAQHRTRLLLRGLTQLLITISASQWRLI
jgi:hypothetical protein